MSDLPNFEYAEPAEAFTHGDIAQGCKPVDQPGVKFFRAYIRERMGGGDFGISSCDRPNVSDHFEGRAWDWHMMANIPDEAARVQEVLDWLFANDWEVFRRLGLKYVIWNRVMYGGGVSSKYTGPNPHVDHVHFSFGWPGARGQTSWFRAAGFDGAAPAPVRPPGSTPVPKPAMTPVPRGGILILLGVATAAYFGVRRFFRKKV